MTKKDFVLIAEVVFAIANDQTRQAIAEMFADRLEHTNPKFDRARFLKACGAVA